MSGADGAGASASALASLLAQDIHLHTSFSDDAVSPLPEVVAAAECRGLRRICISDHVRAATTWLPRYVAEVQAARLTTGVELLTGVEAKILDASGAVDVPADLTGIDRVLIADHQFPGESGPARPDVIAARIAAGELGAAEAVETLVEATCAAIRSVHGPVLAHLFSLLPKIGLTEADVPEPLVAALADTAARFDAILDVNEKWRCPSPAVVRRFLAAGVEVAAGSDSHRAQTVGRFAWVSATLTRAAADPWTGSLPGPGAVSSSQPLPAPLAADRPTAGA